MKVEVRNVKEMKSLSEETMCFSATVVIDGKVAGTASNRGSGGPNEYYPRDLEAKLAEYAKTLPPISMPADIGGESFPQDADTALGEVIDEFLGLRDYRKAVSVRLLLENDKGQILETSKLPKGANVLEMARKFATKPGIVKVLNLLPEAEGYAILKAKAATK